uniref:Mastoparan-like PMM n=1 Tax=Polistes major TaxID=91420 RepID=MAST_POLMJ|nr:RecName: Full=Mastoparan-like PMM; AltName: Full=Mastoparan-like peptide PMM2 [Polistes major]
INWKKIASIGKEVLKAL